MYQTGKSDFNPRTHRGVRLKVRIKNANEKLFQSTHPSWGATKRSVVQAVANYNFNPRTHRGVRRRRFKFRKCERDFNPRTHRGVRQIANLLLTFNGLFQSTHPSWGATPMDHPNGMCVMISIHAPIVGCDISERFSALGISLISIHAPIVGCDLNFFLQQAAA